MATTTEEEQEQNQVVNKKSNKESEKDKSDNSSSSNININKATNQDSVPTNTTTTTTATTVPVRLGIKRIYELFPRQVVHRCKAHRKQKVEEAVHQYIAKVRLQLAQLQQQQQQRNNNDTSSSSDDDDQDKKKKKKKKKKNLEEELEARLQLLNSFWDEYDDPGPIYDIVVFWDGSHYRAVLVDIDIVVTKQQGDQDHDKGQSSPSPSPPQDLLRSLPTLTDFNVEQQVTVFGIVDQMKFGIHFYQNGTILNFFCDVTPHGSHVANIATAAAATTTAKDDSDIVLRKGDVSPSSSLSSSSSGFGSGVAPGAKLVSLKIGDTRMSGMETGTSLMRALIAAVHHKCHVLNISYGEGCSLPNTGRVIQMAEEVVRRHNIIIVSSAGNSGPALSTVGSMGATSSAVLGIAAGITPPMMKANYSMMVNRNKNNSSSNNNNNKDNDEDTDSIRFSHDRNDDDDDESNLDPTTAAVESTFTWSAVGPTTDGDWSVAVMAPGGATTGVPSWTLQKTMLMNGTSMSSPHAAGCVALLLSACFAEGIPTSAARIRRALINTAQPLPNLSVLQQGAGMIQVDRAWDYLQQHRHAVGEDVHFDVRVDRNFSSTVSSSQKPRGVYLRQPDETTTRRKFAIVVDPQFLRIDAADLDHAEQTRRFEFEMNFTLESTAPTWVQAPDHFHLVNDSRSFVIQVDPVKLPPGVHTASVRAMDALHPNRGAIFSVPITVIKTTPPTNPEFPHVYTLGALEFQPAQVRRFFLEPPIGATWMDVTVRDCRNVLSTQESTSRLIVLHTVQLVPNAAYRDHEVHKYLNFVPGQTIVTSVSVEGGVTIEVALARFWSSLGQTELDVTMEFRGIRPVPNPIRIHAGDMGVNVRLHCDFRDEWVRPTAKLTTWWTPLRPMITSTIITPVGSGSDDDIRDVIPYQNKQIYQLVLQYEFVQDEKGSFIPRVPALQGILYESAFESQLVLAFDGDKKYLGVADAWPDNKITAPKGNVTIRLQVRHDDPTLLEKLKDVVTIWIERQLDNKEIDLSVFASRFDLQMGKSPPPPAAGSNTKFLLPKGSISGFWFAEPPANKLPTGCKIGDLLHGKAFFGSGDSSLPGEGKRPKGFPVVYVVGPTATTNKTEQASESSSSNNNNNNNNNDTSEANKDERTVEQRISDAIRDVRLEQLGKLTSKEKEHGKFEELFDQMEVDYPEHIPLFVAKLKHLDSTDGKPKTSTTTTTTTTTTIAQLQVIIQAADAVIDKISEDELALHFGKLLDKENPKEVQKHKTMEQKKGFLIDSLARKAFALLELTKDNENDDPDLIRKLDEVFTRLQAWVDISSNTKLSTLYIEKEIRDGRYGCALKTINKLLSNDKKENGIIHHPLSKSAALYQKRAAIFDLLGYHVLADMDEKMRLIASPKHYAPF